MKHSNLLAGDNDQQTAWYDLVGKFRNYANQFMTEYNQLIDLGKRMDQFPPVLQSQYTSLVNRAQTIQNTITSVTQKIDQAASWLSNMVNGLGGLSQPLGVIQFLPIAIVAGAVTFITIWLTDVSEFWMRLSEFQRLQSEENLTPQQAAEAIKTMSGGFNLDIFKPLAPMILLGLAFIFLPKLSKK